MSSEKKRLRITIQQQTTTQDSYNQPQDTWTDYTTVWASAVNKGGGEFYAAQKINAKTTEVFTIRYSSITKAITEDMRVKFGTRTFNILHINNVDERNIELQLMCEEVK